MDGSIRGYDLEHGVRWALLVGVSRYRTEHGFHPLPGAVADVAEVYNALASCRSPYRIRCLTDDGAFPPTSSQVKVELQKLVQLAGPEDLVLFYFSGHGVAMSAGSFLVPADGHRSFPEESCLAVDWIRHELAESRAAVGLMVLDACHAAPPGKGLVLEPARPFSIQLTPTAAGQAILTSSRHDEQSAVWEEKGLSAFTWFLSRGLEGEAADDAGVVLLSALFRYVSEGLRRWAFEEGRQLQTPVFLARLEGEVPLLRVDPERQARNDGESVASPRRASVIPGGDPSREPTAGGQTTVQASTAGGASGGATTPGPLPSSGPSRPRRSNLPLRGTAFVGREQALEEVRHRLRAHRLVTLKGPGGIGKTRLAEQAAAGLINDYRDGVWLVELAPLRDPQGLTRSVAEVLEIREVAGSPLLEQLIRQLEPRRLLLILDNCEHLVDDVASLVTALLRACPDVSILATSRERLGVEGEQCLEVSPLTVPDPEASPRHHTVGRFEAARLFVARACSSDPSFQLDARTAPLVADLCRRLEGIPLALELAAARLRVLSIDQLVERLIDRLRVLGGGLRGAEDRQRTLRASVDWSYALLTGPEQILFRRMSVFTGGCEIEAVEAVCSGGSVDRLEVLDLLSRLVDRSLVQVDRGAAGMRYHLLEVLREYGLEKLSDAGEGEPLQRAHRDWCLELIEQGDDIARSAQERKWLRRLDLEQANVLEAMRRSAQTGDGEALARFCAGITLYWEVRGHWMEAQRWREVVLARAGGLEAQLRMRFYLAAARMSMRTGELEQAARFAEQALELAQNACDRRQRGLALSFLAELKGNDGHHDEALELLEEGIRLLREDGARAALAGALNTAGIRFAHALRFDDSIRAFEEAIALFRGVGNQRRAAIALFNLSLTLQNAGEVERASAMLEEAYALRAETDSPPFNTEVQRARARLALERGDLEPAVRCYAEVLEQYVRAHDRNRLIELLESCMTIAVRLNDAREMLELLEMSARLRHAIGLRWSPLELQELQVELDAMGIDEDARARALLASAPLRLEEAAHRIRALLARAASSIRTQDT